MPEALRLVSQFENDPKVAKGSYFGRIAGIYGLAKDFKAMSGCQKAAVEQGSGSAGALIDYACGLVQRHKNQTEARQALSLAKEKEITRYIAFCVGMIAIEEGKSTAAQKSLLQALKMAVSHSDQPLTQGWTAIVKAYLCIATGNLGDKTRARQLFRAVKPLLTVRREDELLQRCRAAVL